MFSVTGPVIPECFIDGLTRINNNITTNNSETVSISGELEICVDGSYIPLCGSEDDIDFDVELRSIVRVACDDLGYTGEYNNWISRCKEVYILHYDI